MDKEIAIKLRKCLIGYDLKFVKQFRQFLKLLERNGIPIEDVYKYADDVHQIHMDMINKEIEMPTMPKCPECGYDLELIFISDTGNKVPSNLYGYTWMYYCDNCLYEKFENNSTASEELKRLQKLNKEKE